MDAIIPLNCHQLQLIDESSPENNKNKEKKKDWKVIELLPAPFSSSSFSPSSPRVSDDGRQVTL